MNMHVSLQEEAEFFGYRSMSYFVFVGGVGGFWFPLLCFVCLFLLTNTNLDLWIKGTLIDERPPLDWPISKSMEFVFNL